MDLTRNSAIHYLESMNSTSNKQTNVDELTIVNAVGTGSLGVELDLAKVETDLNAVYTDYDPEIYNGMYVRFDQHGALITIYRTGKYIVSGASSIEELNDTNSKFIGALADLEIVEEGVDTGFSVTNIVTVGNLGKSLDLNALAIRLGLEVTEYEPEQFPGLVYRPINYDAVILCFTSGKVVIPGATSLTEADAAFSHLKKRVN